MPTPKNSRAFHFGKQKTASPLLAIGSPVDMPVNCHSVIHYFILIKAVRKPACRSSPITTLNDLEITMNGFATLFRIATRVWGWIYTGMDITKEGAFSCNLWIQPM